MDTEDFVMAGLINGVAWLIPYCARHHPLQSEQQRVPGTPPLPGTINPECAVRQHRGTISP